MDGLARGDEQTEKCVSSGDIARMKKYGPTNWINGRRMWLGDWAEYDQASYNKTHYVRLLYYWRGWYLDQTSLATYSPATLNTAASYRTHPNTCSVYGVFRLKDEGALFQNGDGSEEFPYEIAIVE